MGRSKEEMEGVTLLGNKDVKYSMDYAPEMLQTFDNKHPDNDYFVKFNCPEFTSLCPITGQPDFATVYISYVPGEKMVESKSLKLYLFSFRNHEGPHKTDGSKVHRGVGQVHTEGRNLHRPVLQLRQTGNKVGGGCLEPSGKPRPLP